jgi:hypothetical protein
LEERYFESEREPEVSTEGKEQKEGKMIEIRKERGEEGRESRMTRKKRLHRKLVEKRFLAQSRKGKNQMSMR